MTYKKLLGAASIIGALAADYLHHQATNVNVWEHQYENWFVTVAQSKNSGLQYTEMKGIDHHLYHKITETEQAGRDPIITIYYLLPSPLPPNCANQETYEVPACDLEEIIAAKKILSEGKKAAKASGNQVQ